MAKVVGVGGVFFKSPDPKRLSEWYTRWLGMNIEDWGGIAYLPKDLPPNSQTVWSPYKAETKYFDPSKKDFMFNLIVDNLEEALKQVKEGGAEIVGEIHKMEYGAFGSFMDPDGNKVELWEPVK